MIDNILLQTSKVLTLDIDSAKAHSYLPVCELKWRRKNLLVKNISNDSVQGFPALTRKQWIENCLRNSWIKRVCVDKEVGDRGIKLWADACYQAKKPVFVRIPSNNALPCCNKTNGWRVKRTLDWLATAIILILISPLMLLITLSIKILTPGPVFYRQWRVGKRGRLFKMYKFRTMVVDAEQKHHQLMTNQKGLHKLENDPRITFIGKWLRKYSLDELPQLFNVLRGEMSLVGPRPWALYDALRLGHNGGARLNALPGITGAWQVEGRSNLLNLDAVTKWDLDYLDRWSLSRDLKILLMTIPKVITGFGAY
ncbi:MAG: heterocyst development glycosyltransferase HepC [Cyanobacteria bacterium J06600_6]